MCVEDPDGLRIETPLQSFGFGHVTAEASARPQQSKQSIVVGCEVSLMIFWALSLTLLV